MLLRPTRIHEKSVRFHISAHGYVQNLAGFIFPHPNTPKTHPILDPNLRRGDFQGVCNTPLHGYVQNLAGFIFPHTDTPKTHPVLDPNLRRGSFEGRMQYTPTWVRGKPTRSHISAHVPAKNAPDFTFPNKDTPKTRPVLHPNRRRGTFRGVCNTPLHGYMKNLAGFIFPHTDTPKTHPISPFPIRIRPKPTRFHPSQ